jgi:tetratricopeptide (TPR) repeat protein
MLSEPVANQHAKTLMVVVVGGLMALYLLNQALIYLPLNLIKVDALRALIANPSQRRDMQEKLLSVEWDNDCSIWWFRGLIAKQTQSGIPELRNWQGAIACKPIYVALLHLTEPEEISLALLGLSTYPRNLEATLWLAELTSTSDPDSAIGFYRSALRLDPINSLTWRQLGDLLVERQPQEALVAYTQSCYLGDVGSHGCLRAGIVAEKLGDLLSAIGFYERSRIEEIRLRAVPLYAQLNQEP